MVLAHVVRISQRQSLGRASGGRASVVVECADCQLVVVQAKISRWWSSSRDQDYSHGCAGRSHGDDNMVIGGPLQDPVIRCVLTSPHPSTLVESATFEHYPKTPKPQ